MKRYLYILASLIAIVITACTSEIDDFDNLVPQADCAITFASSVEQTRATITDIDVLENYGKYHIDAFKEDGSNLSLYFEAEVEYDSQSDGWATAEEYYWPASGALTFYAHSPIEDGDNIVLNDNKDIITYTCPSDIDDQIDLLVETLTGQEYSGTATGIDFAHALSCIEFEVKFADEKNITLNYIDINYCGIEDVRQYSFASQSWIVPETKSYFDKTKGLTTQIALYENKTTTDADANPIVFDEIDNKLIIIPQTINCTSGDLHYISVQVTYSLEGADNSSANVTTGVMPLPAPVVNSVTQNEYKMGEKYKYSITINSEQIYIESITITDSETPVTAYGNIDLGLITESMTYDSYQTALSSLLTDVTATTSSTDEKHYYYTTALRAAELLNDGVRDFVVVGSLGADSNSSSDGKLGYYGSTSSPFFIAANSLGMIPNYTIDNSDEYDNIIFETPESDNLFSIDLRGVYDFQTFGSTHTVDESNSAILDTDAPILLEGIFKDLPLIDEVIFPYGLLAIGDYAFQNCISLKSVDLAEVVHIEEGAFIDCISLTEVYNGALTRVHSNGFDSCEALTTIDLSQVAEIDEYGFVNCSSLTNVNLGKLLTIGKHAFDGCSELTLESGSTIPDFQSVADYAFSGCAKLGDNGSKINLNEAVSVGDHSFNGCANILLESGDLAEMMTIGDNAFEDCVKIGSEHSVSMPLIENIGVSAFEGCSAMNIIEGLENLDLISDNAFKDCTSLLGYDPTSSSELALPNVANVGDYGFYNTGLTSVAFTDKTLTSIGEHAFQNCTSLTTISGLEGVTSVGKYAFSDCVALTELVLPSLTDGNFGRNFFNGCVALQKISLPKLTTNSFSWINEDNVTEESTVISLIGSSSLTAIQEIDLPLLVADIPSYRFSERLNLTTVNLSNAGVVNNGAFYACPELTTVDLSSATSLGDYAFQYCGKLTTIDVSRVTSLGSAVFDNCTALESLDLSSATSLGDYAFQDCEKLTTIDVSRVSSLGSAVFENCTALESLDLSSVTGDFGGWGYFNSNTNLKYLDLSSVESISDGPFNGNTTLVSLDLSSVSGSFGSYQYFNSNTNLKYLDLSSVTEITTQTFHSNETIVSIDLSSATTIGSSAFYNCTALQKLNLSSLVDYVDTNWSFSGITPSQCEIWLSDTQAAEAVDNVWQGITWKAIHKASDNVPFTLVE